MMSEKIGPFTVHRGTNRTGGEMVGVHTIESSDSVKRHMIGMALHEIQQAVWNLSNVSEIANVKVVASERLVVAEINLDRDMSREPTKQDQALADTFFCDTNGGDT